MPYASKERLPTLDEIAQRSARLRTLQAEESKKDEKPPVDLAQVLSLFADLY